MLYAQTVDMSSTMLPSSGRPNVTRTLLLSIVLFFTASAFTTPGEPAAAASSRDAMGSLRAQVTSYAQQYRGLRYRYAGRSPQTGFDCSGFTSYVLKEFDVRVSSSSSLQSTQGTRIPLDAVQAGDLVFFGRSGRIQHVAMVVERNEEGIFCVHSTCTRGIVENILKSSYWKPRILFARDVITDQARPLEYPG
jgi:cell wall-associated NlpC family hydrolase